MVQIVDTIIVKPLTLKKILIKSGTIEGHTLVKVLVKLQYLMMTK